MRAEAELGARYSGSAAVAAVADGRDAGRETLGGPQARDVDVLVEADPRLPLDVPGDPLGEVVEAVAKAAVDGVLEVRMRVDEAGKDDRIVVVLSSAQLFRRSDGDDPAVLELDGTALDRVAVDREHPVGRDDHGVSMLVSTRTARRSTNTDNQIEPS